MKNGRKKEKKKKNWKMKYDLSRIELNELN